MSCLRCNGAGYVTAPAPVPRQRHAEPYRWTSPAGQHQATIFHGRIAERCGRCDGAPS